MPRTAGRKGPNRRRGSNRPSPAPAAPNAKSPAGGGPWWPALVLGLVAVALRVWSVVVLSRDWRISDPALDGRYYMQLATALSHGLSWPSGPFFMTPLYPVLLSFLFRVFPATVLTVQVAQSVLGLATLTLLVAAARRDLGAAAGWALGGLYALYGPILGLESQMLTEGLLLFLGACPSNPSGRCVVWYQRSCRGCLSGIGSRAGLDRDRFAAASRPGIMSAGDVPAASTSLERSLCGA